MASGSARIPVPGANAAGFAAVLQAEHDALGVFVSLLQAEQEILILGAADRLSAIAPEKSAQIELLTRLGQQRDRYLSESNLALNAQGVETWFSRQPAIAATSRKTWLESLRRAEMARQLNLNNGLLIDNRMRQNRQRLSVLQTAVGSDHVYRADGQLGPFRSGRSINRI